LVCDEGSRSNKREEEEEEEEEEESVQSKDLKR
jgi:hypothetical protein